MKHNGSLKIALPIAFVWFGALVGPSMISGAFAAAYYAPYGAVGVLLPMLTMVIAATVVGMGAYITSREKTYSYSELANCMYGKYRKVLTPILEIYMVFAMIVGGSAVVSMGSTFLQELTGLPPIAGAIAVSLISMALVLWGEKLVRASSSAMSIVMIVGMVLLSAFAIFNRADKLGEVMSSFRLPEGVSLWSGISGAIALGLSNTCNALTLCAVEQRVKGCRHSVMVGVCSFVLNSLAFIFSTLLLLPYCPEVLLDAVPTLRIINDFLAVKAPWLPAVYMITMFLALLSSGAPQLHAVAYRVKRIYPKSIKSDQVKNLLTGIVYFVLCIAISFLGLRTIISKGYSLLGYIAIPLLVIPIVIIMPIRYAKQKRAAALKENKEAA